MVGRGRRMISKSPGNSLARPVSSMDPQLELVWKCQSQPCSPRLPLPGWVGALMLLTSCQSSAHESEDWNSILEPER